MLTSIGANSGRIIFDENIDKKENEMHFATIGTDRATPDRKERERPEIDFKKRSQSLGPKPLNLKQTGMPSKSPAKKKLSNQDIAG